jgi:hypothetical protein
VGDSERLLLLLDLGQATLQLALLVRRWGKRHHLAHLLCLLLQLCHPSQSPTCRCGMRVPCAPRSHAMSNFAEVSRFTRT